MANQDKVCMTERMTGGLADWLAACLEFIRLQVRAEHSFLGIVRELTKKK